MHQHIWNPQDVALDFAWLPARYKLVEPVRATPVCESAPGTLWDTLAEFYPGSVDPDLTVAIVILHHPDRGSVRSRVAFGDLRGRWDEVVPEALVESTGWHPRKTWAEVARARYEWVQEQRDLADRLTALGVPRCRRHYAGFGGSSMDVGRQLDTRLVLDHKELLQIVQLAERGNT